MGAFIKNRFIRLFPPMLLCSLIIFFCAPYLDKEKLFPTSHNAWNFFPSLTFINPKLLSRVFNRNFGWLNGSYWSLWVEIQFYIISSIIYYTNRKKYFTHILITSLILSISKPLIKFVCLSSIKLPIPASDSVKIEILFWIDSAFDIATYIPFFAVGVVFHKLYKGHRILDKTSILLVALTVITSFIRAKTLNEYIIISFMHILFALMVFKPMTLSFLNNPLLIRIGVLSYTMYLIHERIGVLILKYFGSYLGSLSPLAPWILLVLTVLFAELSYRIYEKKINRLLKRLLFKPIFKNQD